MTNPMTDNQIDTLEDMAQDGAIDIVVHGETRSNVVDKYTFPTVEEQDFFVEKLDYFIKKIEKKYR